MEDVWDRPSECPSPPAMSHLTKEQLRSALDDVGVSPKGSAKKEELVALYHEKVSTTEALNFSSDESGGEGERGEQGAKGKAKRGRPRSQSGSPKKRNKGVSARAWVLPGRASVRVSHPPSRLSDCFARAGPRRRRGHVAPRRRRPLPTAQGLQRGNRTHRG